MSNPETDAARATIAQLEARIADLDARAAALQTERTQLEADLDAARVVIAAEHAEAQRVAREPADRKTLEGLTETLHARLRSAPRNSPTAARVRAQSGSLADESMTVSARLGLVRSLLQDLARLVQLDGDIFAAATPPLSGRE